MTDRKKAEEIAEKVHPFDGETGFFTCKTDHGEDYDIWCDEHPSDCPDILEARRRIRSRSADLIESALTQAREEGADTAIKIYEPKYAALLEEFKGVKIEAKRLERYINETHTCHDHYCDACEYEIKMRRESEINKEKE